MAQHQYSYFTTISAKTCVALKIDGNMMP